MANAGRFFGSAIPSPGGAPVTTRGLAPPEIETAPDLHIDIVPSDTDQVAPADLSEHRSIFEGRFHENGWDALAFYAPYHRHGPSLWGVYFVGDAFLGAVDTVQALMESRNETRPQFSVAVSLLKVIRVHELFHFSVEWAATHAEVLTGAGSLYNAYLARGREAGLREPALTEEAIATADEIRRARRLDAPLAGALADLSHGLPGYGDFERHLRRAGAEGRKALVGELIGHASTGELLSQHMARPYHRSVPVHWIPPRIAAAGLDELLLRILALSIRDVVRDAERRPGASVDRSGGKHPTKIRVSGKRPVPISLNWDDGRVPTRVVKQLATLFDVEPAEYCSQVMNRRQALRAS